MAQSFQAEVDAWVTKSRKLLLAVFQTSTQFVVEEVIERTPVDTGYAKNSWTVTLDGPLPMRGQQGDGYQAPPYVLSIAGAGLGDTIYLSAIANYMVHLEYGARGRAGVGMVRLATQNWQQHVDKATAMAKARVR